MVVRRLGELCAALELGVEAENARIRERQDLRQYKAGDVLRRIDLEIGIGRPGPGQAAAASSRRYQVEIGSLFSR